MFIGNTLHTVGQMLVFMEVGAGCGAGRKGQARAHGRPRGTERAYTSNPHGPRACASQWGCHLATLLTQQQQHHHVGGHGAMGLQQMPLGCCITGRPGPRENRIEAVAGAINLTPNLPPQISGLLTVTVRLSCPWLAVVDPGRVGARMALSLSHENGTTWTKWINTTDTGAQRARHDAVWKWRGATTGGNDAVNERQSLWR